jgi:hypothetical protein
VPNRHARGFMLPAGLIAVLLFAGRCIGQIPSTEAVGGPSPNNPWLHTGLVISSTWLAAYYPGHATDFKQDEHGDWLGPDGTHLKATDRPGTSAGGITQSVISCIGGKLAIIVTSSYADMRVLGVRDPALQGFPNSYVVNLEETDLWIDPVKLAQMKNDPANHIVIFPVQWKAGNQIVDAMRIVYIKGEHYMDHVYDRRSGLCLHAADSSTGAAPQLKYIAPGEAAAGDTQLSSFEFISLRDVHTPWANEAMPAWTGQFKALHYRGETRFNNATFGGQPPSPITLDVTRQDIGKNWVSLSGETSVFLLGRMQPQKKTLYVCGQDQYASYFAGPAALAKLHAGQVLDTDPLTHVQTTVSQADANSVTIHSSSAGAEVQRTYDRQSGKMTGFSQMDMLTKFQTTIQLQSEE